MLLAKNRDRLSIIADVLEVAKQGANKTRIMFMANLSFTLLEKYLEVVTAADFIKIRESKYTLSERGQEFLRQYNQFHERYDKAQQLLDALGSEREKLARVVKAAC